MALQKTLNRSGFTLVDLIVAVGLFAIIASIALGGFAYALRTQRQASALIAANNNVSQALEQMAREMRTGRIFCDNRSIFQTANLCSSQDRIAFVAATGELVQYCLVNNAIYRSVGGVCGQPPDSLPITGGKVLVFNLQFDISGNHENDGIQPRITIVVDASANEPGLTQAVTHLQTTVSSRLPDG